MLLLDDHRCGVRRSRRQVAVWLEGRLYSLYGFKNKNPASGPKQFYWLFFLEHTNVSVCAAAGTGRPDDDDDGDHHHHHHRSSTGWINPIAQSPAVNTTPIFFFLSDLYYFN